MSDPVAVLGGGPAGLYAALLLARRDIPVVIVERGERPGGLAGGTEIAGMPVDFGSHRLHPSIDPEILDDVASLLGDDLQLRRRHGRILLDGAWIPFPIAPGALARRLRPSALVRLGLGAAAASLRPTRDDTFAGFVATGLGRPMGEMFYFPYARKIWGVEPDRLAGEQARRRISADSPARLIRKALSRSGTGREFLYPAGGFGQISDGIAAAATGRGAEIRLGTTVTRVSPGSTRTLVDTNRGTIPASFVLSTIPIGTLAHMLDPPDPVADAAAGLRSRSMVLVYLVVDRPQWTEFDAHYFPGEDVPFTRISEPKNYRDGRDPDDVTVLCVEIPADVGDVIWSMDDADLAAEIRGHIVTTGLPDPGTHGVVHRLPHAYPVYDLGSRERFETVTSFVDDHDGIVTFGRQGLFAHDNTHHALVMAHDAVACVESDGSFDTARWDNARRRFAEHVVED